MRTAETIASARKMSGLNSAFAGTKDSPFADVFGAADVGAAAGVEDVSLRGAEAVFPLFFQGTEVVFPLFFQGAEDVSPPVFQGAEDVSPPLFQGAEAEFTLC